LTELVLMYLLDVSLFILVLYFGYCVLLCRTATPVGDFEVSLNWRYK